MTTDRGLAEYLAYCLEGFFYGIYSGIFAMYLQYQVSEKGAHKKTSIVFYSILILYILSTAIIALDVASATEAQILLSAYTWTNTSVLIWNANILNLILIIMVGCADFMSQLILIYRCWIVWNRNIRVVIIPLIFSVTFFVIWIFVFTYPIQREYDMQNSSTAPIPHWPADLLWTCLVLSLTVNATVTGLIVFRIMKVYLEVKPTLPDQNLGATGGGRKLRSIIFILIESGMALFAIQLVRLVLTVIAPLTNSSSAAASILQPIIPIHQMLNGITPTIILVRVAMGLSFHNQESMEEVTSSLHFASDHPNPNPETGSIGIERQERSGGFDIEVSNRDIETGSIRLIERQERSEDFGIEVSNRDVL